jgi:hypothetical protein
MVDYLLCLQREGPMTYKQIPKKPKSNIQMLLGESKPSTKLIGMELHKYLERYIVNTKVDLQLKWNPTDLESVKNTLVTGFQLLKSLNASVLATYIDYGFF